MGKYILQRIFLMFVTLFIILSLTFLVIRLMPNNTAPALGKDSDMNNIMNTRYGFNKPILEQYGIWLKNVFPIKVKNGHLTFESDWGISTKVNPKVETWAIMLRKLPHTMNINIWSFFFSIPVGFVLGIVAALKKNKMTDHFISFWVIFFISVPSFVYATLLRYFFAFEFGWFPLQYANETDPTSKMIASMILPILALSFGPIATLTRFARAELTEVLTSDFMLLARTKGLSKRQATVRHALRNSMVPLVPIIIGNFVGILGGSIVIESIFGVPGIGSLTITAIQTLDYPLVMTTFAFYETINLLTVLVIDLSYGLIDPRIRMGGRKK